VGAITVAQHRRRRYGAAGWCMANRGIWPYGRPHRLLLRLRLGRRRPGGGPGVRPPRRDRRPAPGGGRRRGGGL